MTPFQLELLELFRQLKLNLRVSCSPEMSFGEEADNRHFQFGMVAVDRIIEQIKKLRVQNIKEYVDFLSLQEAQEYEIYFNQETKSRIYGDKGSTARVRNKLQLDKQEIIAHVMVTIFSDPSANYGSIDAKSVIGNQSITAYQESLSRVFNSDISVIQAPNNSQLPEFLSQAVFIRAPRNSSLTTLTRSDEALKASCQFQDLPDDFACIYVPKNKLLQLHQSIKSSLHCLIVDPLQQRLNELKLRSRKSFSVNDNKSRAYEDLLTKLRNAPLEMTPEAIFREWEKSLNTADQLNTRTAMVSHRSMFYSKGNDTLTSSEKTIREIRKIICNVSVDNRREEIIHRLIHRLSHLNQLTTSEKVHEPERTVAGHEKDILEELLSDIQTLPLDSTNQSYHDKIIEWEGRDCLFDNSQTTNKAFLQTRRESACLFSSSSDSLLEKLKEELVPTQVVSRYSFDN